VSIRHVWSKVSAQRNIHIHIHILIQYIYIALIQRICALQSLMAKDGMLLSAIKQQTMRRSNRFIQQAQNIQCALLKLKMRCHD
jgi:hypothetical protein